MSRRAYTRYSDESKYNIPNKNFSQTYWNRGEETHSNTTGPKIKPPSLIKKMFRYSGHQFYVVELRFRRVRASALQSTIRHLNGVNEQHTISCFAELFSSWNRHVECVFFFFGNWTLTFFNTIH